MRQPWVRTTVLLDVAVVAYVKAGRPREAQRALDLLRDETQRSPDNLRNRYLRALVRRATDDAGA